MNRRVAAKLVLTLCAILGAGLSLPARADWISLGGSEDSRPAVEVRQLAWNKVQVNVSLRGFSSQPVTIQGRTYSKLRIPGNWFTLEAGQPELPFLTTRLMIPESGNPAVRVVESSWREIPTDPIVPGKGNIMRDVDPATVPWTFGEAYSSGGVFPATPIGLGTPFILRDLRGVGLQINPLRWDADRGVLLVLENIMLEVETTGSGGLNEKKYPATGDLDHQFAGLYDLGFDNYQDSGKYNQLETEGTLLVVCPEEFASVMDPFLEWKKQRGLSVERITTQSVGGTAEGIQAAIKQRYFSPAGLTYVILVGDVEQVPTNLGTYEGAFDDTRYACVEGNDFYPDLFVSRISAADQEDVQVQVAKFIHYERDPDPNGTWYSRASGLASDQGIPTDSQRAGLLRDDLLSYSFTSVDEIYAPTATTEMIIQAVNEGRSLINYLGHGSGFAWSSPYLPAADVLSLQNGWMSPWILDVSCYNGAFGWGECFAEAWMRAGTPEQPQGAVAMFSASTSTPWVPPTVMQAEAVSLLVNSQANVIGSLFYHGIMEVLDTYPGDEGVQLVEQYNIFGDCSLVVRTAQPQVMSIQHPTAVPLEGMEFPVLSDMEGAMVALFSGGVLHGSGITDPTGSVVLDLVKPVTAAGEVTLTVTGFNRLPYIINLPAVEAQELIIDPAEIPVGETTRVTVRLLDPVTVQKATSDILVSIEGFGVEGLEQITGPDGVAEFDVTPRYGETLIVRGRESGALFDLFGADLPVTGSSPLPSATIFATTPMIDLPDTLATNMEGQVTGSAAVSGLVLALEYFNTLELFTSTGGSATGFLTPRWPGFVKATLMREGYSIYTKEIEVIPALGTLDGTVVDGDADLATIYNARISGFHPGDDPTGVPAFEVFSDYYGNWALPQEIAIGYYDIHVEKLGYFDYLQTVLLIFGENSLQLSLTQSPRGLVSGTVISAEDSSGLFTLVEVFRADTGEEVAYAWSTGAEGGFNLPLLAYFEYDILVSPSLFTPQKKRIIVGQSQQEIHFAVEPTSGSILVIDDNISWTTVDGVRSENPIGNPVTHSARLDKSGQVVAPAYTAPASRSAQDLLLSLSGLGYEVSYSPSAGYDPASWQGQDLVVVSSGDKTGTLNPQLKIDLLAFTAVGGKLLIEGGDVAHDHVTDGEFARRVLHISDWVADNPGDVGVYKALHPVMDYPNPIVSSMDFTGSGSGSADAVTVLEDAVTAASWTNSWSDASVVCYGPEFLLGAGQTVFFAFDYAGLDPVERGDLLHNAVHWLIVPEAGRAAVSGRVEVLHSPDNSGVAITLTPGNFTTITDTDGFYSFDSLYAGNYTLTVTKPGWTSVVFSFGLTQEQLLTDVDFELSDVMTSEFRDSPGVVIPDNDPGGVTCGISNSLFERATRVEVFLDITHPYLADLVIDLTSPSGYTVRLHQNNGGDGDDIHAWYPTETPSYGVLDAFIGEGIDGIWQLHAMDVGPFDEGIINEWALRFTYAAGLSTAEQSELPSVLALEGNHPNPFNPVTTIRFALPLASPVDLSVFDVAGRRVATLINGLQGAGYHEVTWDGRDAAGRTVASGTFFYQLKVGEDVKTGKMLMLK